MSPRVGPRPAAVRYQEPPTQISDNGAEIAFEDTGAAYMPPSPTCPAPVSITATVDHDGPLALRERLVVSITDTVHRPDPRPRALTHTLA
ncbi:MAG: hypothetical protein ACRDYA_04835 [Egibacteraceae bacterium]